MTYQLRHPENWELTQATSWLSQGVEERVVQHTARALELEPEDPSVRRRVEYLRHAAAVSQRPTRVGQGTRGSAEPVGGR